MKLIFFRFFEYFHRSFMASFSSVACRQFGDGSHYHWCSITKGKSGACDCSIIGKHFREDQKKTLLEVAAQLEEMQFELQAAYTIGVYDQKLQVLMDLRPTVLKMLPPGLTFSPLGAADVAAVETYYNSKLVDHPTLSGRGSLN
jgi:hypothetical protein